MLTGNQTDFYLTMGFPVILQQKKAPQHHYSWEEDFATDLTCSNPISEKLCWKVEKSRE